MSITVRKYNPQESLQLAENTLRHVSGAAPASAFVCVGDTIDTDEQEGFLRGHGTQVVDGKLVATLCGVVERVNKLVYVKPLRSRYSAQLGDVVVGRVVEIAGNRWKVSLNSRQEAALMLSAVNLPGGLQRRRNAEDELAMRSCFREGDLLSAEVQALHGDGSVMLHTRSSKYGKLQGGQLVSVPPNLVRRQKQHFCTLDRVEPPVDVILGLNGLIWVQPHVPRAAESAGAGGMPQQPSAPQQQQQQQPPAANGGGASTAPGFSRQQHAAVVRVAAAVAALTQLYLQVYPATIWDAYELSVHHGVDPRSMLGADFLQLVAGSEAVRRHAEAAAE